MYLDIIYSVYLAFVQNILARLTSYFDLLNLRSSFKRKEMADIAEAPKETSNDEHVGTDIMKDGAHPAILQVKERVLEDVNKPNGWNGTFVNGKDPYALMRGCNANSR